MLGLLRQHLFVHLQIFAGDKNIYSGTRHELRFPFTARYVKFLPLTWDKLACMRVEVYGREGKKAMLEWWLYLHVTPISIL